MIRSLLQQYRIHLIVFLVIASIIIIILSALKDSVTKPEIVASLPPNNAQSVGLTTPIRIAFNQTVDASSLNITSTPEEVWLVKNLDPQTILIEHRLAFAPFTDYSLSVSQNNHLLGQLNFTTIKAQGDLRLVQTIEDQMKIDYPLSKHLPYETLSFKAVYSAPLTLEITIKNLNLTSEEVIAEMKAWVTKNGGDAESHKYVIAN